MLLLSVIECHLCQHISHCYSARATAGNITQFYHCFPRPCFPRPIIFLKQEGYKYNKGTVNTGHLIKESEHVKYLALAYTRWAMNMVTCPQQLPWLYFTNTPFIFSRFSQSDNLNQQHCNVTTLLLYN